MYTCRPYLVFCIANVNVCGCVQTGHSADPVSCTRKTIDRPCLVAIGRTIGTKSVSVRVTVAISDRAKRPRKPEAFLGSFSPKSRPDRPVCDRYEPTRFLWYPTGRRWIHEKYFKKKIVDPFSNSRSGLFLGPFSVRNDASSDRSSDAP